MGEIQDIMRQFAHGTGQWQQFLKSIRISNIHGWSDQEVFFHFPVVAIVGENGIGKSTFLKAAICAYKNKSGKDYYPSNMFMSTRWDAAAIKGASIDYKIRLGDQERTLRWRKTNDWGYSPKKNKPPRDVFFLDISRTLPLDATAGYAKIAKLASEEVGRAVELDDETITALSFVLGQDYSRARFVGTNINSQREVGLLTRDCGEISQFHQGAGEDAMLDTFKLLQTLPNQSLLVIDEVENSLHPQAQRRFVQYLLKLARQKKIQVILSTHSPFVLDELPLIARIMLVKLSDKKDVLYGVSTGFALSNIDEKTHPDLHVFLEDEEAVAMFWSILKQDQEKYSEYCLRISTFAVGSCNVVYSLHQLSKQGKLPYKSLSIIDGDKKEDYPDCLSLPGSLAPERQVLNDLKAADWGKLEERFGIGAGSLFKVLDDSMLLEDHHQWLEYIGDHIRKSKDAVWDVLLDEWHKRCNSIERIKPIIQTVQEKLEIIV